MKTAYIGFLFVLAATSVPKPLLAGDWPQWGGRNARDFVSGEEGLPDAFAPDRANATNGVQIGVPGVNLKWSVKLGSQAYVTPAVAQGRVFIGSNDAGVDTRRFSKTQGSVLDCLDEQTGKRLWRLVIPRLRTRNKLFNFDDMNLGLCSSPTVDGDRVYVMGSRGDVLCLDICGQSDGNSGPFTDEGRYMFDTRILPDKPGRYAETNAPPPPSPVALRPDDADIVWRYDFLKKLDVWPQDAVDCSILVYGNYLYVCTCNGVDKSHKNIPSPNAPDMIVLDKRTGKLLATIGKPLGTAIFHGDWSSPALAEVNGRPLVLWGGGDGFCYAFDAALAPNADGRPGMLKEIWRYDCDPPQYRMQDGEKLPYNKGGQGPSEVIATPVVWSNRVYVAVGQDSRHGKGKGCFSCIDATLSGDVSQRAKIWDSTAVDRSFSSAAVTDDGLAFIADYTGVLRCFDAVTGKEYWNHDLEGRVFCSPLCVDGKVYIGTEAGRVTVAEAHRQKKILREIRFDGPIYATPVAANGTLYIATQRKLYAFRRDQPNR